mmetsp:Transcript_43465/g.125634  ORF Transcript_43465/g.125634 Transcript_43465/m.125634 type:complete len:295 (-) Transcript_43465:25-909(-)
MLSMSFRAPFGVLFFFDVPSTMPAAIISGVNSFHGCGACNAEPEGTQATNWVQDPDGVLSPLRPLLPLLDSAAPSSSSRFPRSPPCCNFFRAPFGELPCFACCWARLSMTACGNWTSSGFKRNLSRNIAFSARNLERSKSCAACTLSMLSQCFSKISSTRQRCSRKASPKDTSISSMNFMMFGSSCCADSAAPVSVDDSNSPPSAAWPASAGSCSSPSSAVRSLSRARLNRDLNSDGPPRFRTLFLFSPMPDDMPNAGFMTNMPGLIDALLIAASSVRARPIAHVFHTSAAGRG